MKKILVIPGSMREDGLSQSVARGLVSLDIQGYDMKALTVGHLPFYNENLDSTDQTPQEWKDFRNELTQADAVIFVTPEYNRNTSAPLSNAIDVGSRPYQDNYRNNKRVGIISVTGGPLGGFAANNSLRQSGALLNMDMIAQPNGYFPFTQELLNEDGSFNQEGITKFAEYLQAFVEWLEK